MIWTWFFNHIPDFVKILKMSITSPGFFVDEMAYGLYSSIPCGNSKNRMGILGNPWRIDDHGTFVQSLWGNLHPIFGGQTTFFGDGHLKVISLISLKHFMRCFLGGWRKKQKIHMFYQKNEGKQENLQIPTPNSNLKTYRKLPTSPNSPTQKPFKWKIGTVQR